MQRSGGALGVSLRENHNGISLKPECVLRVVGNLVVAARVNNLCRNRIEREEVHSGGAAGDVTSHLSRPLAGPVGAL